MRSDLEHAEVHWLVTTLSHGRSSHSIEREVAVRLAAGWSLGDVEHVLRLFAYSLP